MIRSILILVFIIISYLLQTTCNSIISIGNVTPNLMLILVCVFALLRGKKEGLIIGFVSGLLLDLYYGYGDVIGFNSLVFMYIGYLNGLFTEFIYTDDIMVPVLFTGICDFGYNFIYYVIAFALRNKLNFGIYFKKIIFPEIIYTVFLTIFLYKIYKWINDKLESKEKGEEKVELYDTGNIRDNF